MGSAVELFHKDLTITCIKQPFLLVSERLSRWELNYPRHCSGVCRPLSLVSLGTCEKALPPHPKHVRLAALIGSPAKPSHDFEPPFLTLHPLLPQPPPNPCRGPILAPRLFRPKVDFFRSTQWAMACSTYKSRDLQAPIQRPKPVPNMTLGVTITVGQIAHRQNSASRDYEARKLG